MMLVGHEPRVMINLNFDIWGHFYGTNMYLPTDYLPDDIS